MFRVYGILILFSDVGSRCSVYDVFRLCVILVLFFVKYVCYICSVFKVVVPEGLHG